MFNHLVERGKKNIESHTYYHGSATLIQDAFLQPKEQFNSIQNKRIIGAFVTSDKTYAKFFALIKCLSKGQCKLDGNKIFLEHLANPIKTEFFLYTVHEPIDKCFIHDKGTEYYSTSPIKIHSTETCNTLKEIQQLKYEIYVLDKPLENKIQKNTNNNINIQLEMNQVIKDKKYHRVDIDDLIQKHNSKKTSQTTHFVSTCNEYS